jgi:hypothetical protein
MTTAGDPLPAHAELERRYRRLLRAYPVGYRRVHGDEILATLMDCAEPGRRRPGRADVVDIARGALRQWFRLPVGLTAPVAAVLSALVLGAMGAAAGSWLAWETAADLPSDSVALQTTETLAGARLTAPKVDRHDGWRVDWRTIRVTDNDGPGFPNWSLEAAQASLRSDGWTIGRGNEFTSTRIGDAGSPTVQTILATRDGHLLTVNAYTPVVPDGSGTTIATYITQATPGGEPGAVLLGWLLGAVTGWLLTGWASYRLRSRAIWVRAAAVALGLTALWSAVDPTTDLYLTLRHHTFADPGVPIYPSYGSVIVYPQHVGMTLALAVTILALAATGRRRPIQPTAAAA